MLKNVLLAGFIVVCGASCVNRPTTNVDICPLNKPFFMSKDAGIMTEKEILELANNEDPYISDVHLRDKAMKAFIPILNQNKFLSKEDIIKQADSRKCCSLPIPTTLVEKQKPADLYQKLVDSTMMIFGFYPCSNPNCSWHIGGVSTGFVISEDGIIATNYHVTQLKGMVKTLGFMTRDGRCFTLKEVLAADPLHDVAILKLNLKEGEKLIPLALRPNAPIGTNINIVSHPSGYFYLMTKGILSRRAKWIRSADNINTNESESQGRQSQTKNQKFIFCDTIMTDAEYAGGSSGGALCDDEGNVIGMVSSTRPIFAGVTPQKPQGHSQQMVLRFCVPVEKIIQLFQNPKEVNVVK